MPGIFISYRREDSQDLAGRLFDRLAQRFGRERVFRDIDAIDPGANFGEVIGERIGGCDALVALIGRGWIEAKDAEGRHRLDLPRDMVKAEIAAALAQGKLVIPVLIEETPMPARGALPAELQQLADRNALRISDSRFDFDVGRLASAIEKTLPDGSAIASTDLREPIQPWVLKRFGLLALVVLACAGIWWQWDHISVLPGVQPLVARVAEKALPKAVPGKFNIALAHLDGDDKHEMERLIRESLAEFPNVATLSFDRLIASKQDSTGKDEHDGHEHARKLLHAANADVLIWGVVLKQGGKSVAKLYWTPARDVAQARSAGRYQTTEDLSLSSMFWQDLTNVLGLLVANNDADFVAQEGQYSADRLEPFIQRVRELVRSNKTEQWNATTRANVLTILGNALTTYADQSGRNEPLQEAIALHGEALKLRPRDTAPVFWAATQNSLGVALVILGQRESNPARLNQAVSAYRDALQERTRERAPLLWARTQNNLGTALRILGQREPDDARLDEAVAAYHEALLERTREKVPLAWATTQNNLGDALRILGERHAGTVRLNDAVNAYREALLERTREKVPLYWAATQNNLGVALGLLGERESDPARLDEAVTAYRKALQERTREKVPLYWAATQNNLGNALRMLGQREAGSTRLDEAVAALREALQERTRQKVPLDWATTQNNLGNALRVLGERASDPARLDEAVAALREALQERTREKVPLDWALTQNNLGNALRVQGKRESGTARLSEAAIAYEAALVVLRSAQADFYAQVTERNLQRVRDDIAQRNRVKAKAGAHAR